MRLISKLYFIILLCSVFSTFAADKDDAIKAANEILTTLDNREYNRLWENQTSEFLKKATTKQSFVANMTMSRQSLGKLKESKFIDMTYALSDPATGYKGEIYAFNYLNSYHLGSFYERVVVVKESNGKFKMSGIWGVPAQ